MNATTKRQRALQSPEHILQGMDSLDASIRNIACARAAALPPEELLKLAETEVALYWQRVKQGSRIAFGWMGLLFLCVMLQRDMMQMATLLGIVGFVSMSLAIWLAWYVPTRAHKSMETVLSGLDDPRFVGPALTMLLPDNMTQESRTRSDTFNARSNVIKALNRMLPRLRADHADLLTKTQRQALLSLLTHASRRDRFLTLNILFALRQVGDAEAVPVVQKLTRSRMPDIRVAAQECLEYLNVRVDQKRQEQTLLRASGVDAHAPETLLRPSLNADNTPAEQLLRPQA